MKHFANSFKRSVKDRAASMIFGTYALTWLFFNWRGIYILLRPKNTPEATLLAFDQAVPFEYYYYYPFLAATAILLIYPWIQYGYFTYQAYPRKNRMLQTYKLERELLEAKRSVLSIEHDIEIDRRTREHHLEMQKLENETERKIELMDAETKLHNAREKLKTKKKSDLE
jgi:hypothetical protein